MKNPLQNESWGGEILTWLSKGPDQPFPPEMTSNIENNLYENSVNIDLGIMSLQLGLKAWTVGKMYTPQQTTVGDGVVCHQ